MGRFTSAALAGRLGGSLSSGDELPGRLTELETLHRKFNAREIEQDSPGLFRRTVHALSGFNYSIAGAVEELASGNGPAAAIGRATRELFAAFQAVPIIGDAAEAVFGKVEGEERAFGEVFERLGVKTVSLADALPMYEGTFLGGMLEAINLRGAAGIAADIITDPLTYVTFGLSSVGRRTGTIGVKHLSKAGRKRLVEIQRSVGIERGAFAVRNIDRSKLGLADAIEEDDLVSFLKKNSDADERVAKYKRDIIEANRVTDKKRATPKLATILDEVLTPAEKDALGLVGEASEITTKALGEISDEALTRIVGLGDEALFDPGGIKFAGIVIPGTPGLGRAFKREIVETANKFEFGSKVLESANRFGEASRAWISDVFHPFKGLGSLPPSMRSTAESIAREMTGTNALMKMRYHNRIESSKFMAYLKNNPDRAELIIAVREGTAPQSALRAGQETEAARELFGLFDELKVQGQEAGFLRAESEVVQRAATGGKVDDIGYFVRFYDNDPEEFLEVMSAWQSRYPAVANKHAKERIFATREDAIRISKQLNRVSKALRAAGRNVPIYPVLKPNNNIPSSVIKYADWHVDQLTRRGMFAEFRRVFGREIDSPAAMDAIADVTQPIALETKEASKIHRWFGDDIPGPKHLTESFEDGLQENIGKYKGKTTSRWARDLLQAFNGQVVKRRQVVNAKKLLDSMSDDGKREFFRRLFVGSDSPEAWVSVVEEFGPGVSARARARINRARPGDLVDRVPPKNYERYFPKIRQDLEGTVETAIGEFGESAKYVTRAGELWGDTAIQIPKLIADYAENGHAKIFNTKDFQVMRDSLKWLDRFNNWFKTGVYAFWPSSVVRDAYSNVALMSYRIGWHAIDPSLHRHSIGVLAGRKGALTTKAGLRISYDAIEDAARKHNVILSGRVFAEHMQDGSYRLTQSRTGRLVNRALEIRASVDNESRVALFTQNLIDGLSVEDAASSVAKFLFNYNEVSAFHRDVIKRFIPFGTFTSKNIQLHAKFLRENPGIVLNQLKPFRGRSEENDSMIQWESEALKIRLDKDGKTVRMLTGIDLPIRNLDVLWRGSLNKTIRHQAGMLTPIVKILPELALGSDFFTGRSLDRTRSDAVGKFIDTFGTPGPVKDWLGYKKDYDRSGRPRYSFSGDRFNLLFRSWFLSRAISTSDRQFREYSGDDGGFARSTLDFLTGIRPKDIDMTEQKRFQMLERIRMLEDSLTKRGVFSTFNKAFIPLADERAEFR